MSRAIDKFIELIGSEPARQCIPAGPDASCSVRRTSNRTIGTRAAENRAQV